MSEDLFYDRTRNLSGIAPITEFDYTPSYGSSVSFSSNNLQFDVDDNYYQLIPKGINNLGAVFNLKYQVDEVGAGRIANYYEKSKGVDIVNIVTDQSIYKNISGYCTAYSITHVNNQNYQIDVSLEVTESPSVLNWSGMNYLKPDFENWQSSQGYKKYDIVYTGVNDSKINNFFYCTEDHSSTESNSPTGVDSSWTQDFFWKPDVNAKSSVKFDVNRFDNGGYPVFSKIKDNTAKLETQYSFSNISTKQLKSMLHFLENKAGYRRFRHDIPSVFNRPKVYICPSWSHDWVYNNAHTLQVTFQEDPMGVIPKNS